MRFNYLLLMLGMILLINVTAQASSQQNNETVVLTIKPLACVVKSAGESCQMTVTAQWQSKQPINACLFQQQQSLSCWQQQRYASQQLNISLQDDMLFTLKNSSGKVLASQRVKINISQPVKYRRRLRAQWSLF
ncbi:hypothetical protein tinsulaeT_08230 [Thalassotalea insulae]|uniref:DUF3019 domain-containing protein n=1 Tax=Thalassotalea insulae TaxID=2056778 RepID=A0ABQ6GNA3_9GAMM|nr:DUF3019 domain-containing protein [Thalassotalea insulae]GLX77483.1 hypothetical protein tinsulaeT_08230 [Thalassotalea insulae]